MSVLSRSQIILTKINQFYRINSNDTDEKIKSAIYELFHQWLEVLNAGYDANNDELFHLNISRTFLTKIFAIGLFKDYFQDHAFTQDIYQTCFDLLINHIDIFRKKDLTSVDIFLQSNLMLIMDLVSHLTSFLWYSDTEIFYDNAYQLFFVIREYVDQNNVHANLTDTIISFIWNLSDNSSFIPIFIKANYTKSLLEWIKNCEKKFRDDKQTALINILLNMIRHDDGIDEFNRFHTLNIIEQIEINSNLSFTVHMIRILLTDINEIKSESIEFLNKLVEMIIDAEKNAKYRCDGSHISELITVLTKLFLNQDILHIILNEISIESSILIDLFITLLIKLYPKLNSNNDPGENFTCVLLLNIFLSISYHQEYSQILYNNEQLIAIIKNLANNEQNFSYTFMPRTLKNIQQAAIEFLKNQQFQSI